MKKKDQQFYLVDLKILPDHKENNPGKRNASGRDLRIY